MEGMPCIVILQRGWVWLGTLHFVRDNPLFGYLENAATIRRWGTTKGLEELADSGVTSDTVLDKGITKHFFPMSSVIGIIELNMENEKWIHYFQ